MAAAGAPPDNPTLEAAPPPARGEGRVPSTHPSSFLPVAVAPPPIPVAAAPPPIPVAAAPPPIPVAAAPPPVPVAAAPPPIPVADEKRSKKRKQKLQVEDSERHGDKSNPGIGNIESPRSKKLKRSKNKGAAIALSTSPRVTSSPGINILVSAATRRRESINAATLRRAKMAGSPKRF